MIEEEVGQPDSTAVRTALWRALHVDVDPPPHVLRDEIGLALAAPEDDWRERRDMDVEFTRPFRASIVARARFIEDLVEEAAAHGVGQYIILGAGLDTFAQRRPEIGSRLRVFEVDQPTHVTWKQRRLIELNYEPPDWLHLVGVDFERESWVERLVGAGFDPSLASVVVSTGVTMYLTREANKAALQQVATLAAGTTFATTFLWPLELAEPDVRPGIEMAARGAETSGTPFISYFTSDEIVDLALESGFREAAHVSASALSARYFADRSDGLRPPNNAEDLLIATT